MYNIVGLIPTRFLSLVAHLVVGIALLWGSKQSVMGCLSAEVTDIEFRTQHYQLVVGLSLALGMIAFELLSFLSGVTMFHSTSALLSIGCHCSATIALTYFILDSWQCGWFWWVFVLCSVLPALTDLCIETPAVRQSGWSFRLVTAAVATTIGASLPVGYNIGVVNAPADMIKVFCNESVYTRYDAVMSNAELDVLWSTIVSVFLVGGITGSLSGSWLADTVGRKGVYIISSVLHILGGVMFYACVPANSVEMLLLGRLLVGLAGGLITGIVPMYLTELSPVQLRGAMGVMCPLGLTFGVLVAQVAGLREILGTEETWPHLLSFFVILVAMCGLVTPILPESPKYLYVVRKQPQLALKELSKIRGLPISSLTDEVLDLQQAQRTDEQTGISWNIATVFKDKELLLPLLLVCAMQAGQQFSGINAVFYYSVSIFKTTGLNEQQSQLANIGCGSANLLMGIVSIFLMSHCNRRKLFLISCVTASIFLILLGLSIAFIESLFWMSYVSIVAILSFVLFYGLGLGPIPYFVGSELFEVGPRPSAMALGSMSNWGGNFIVGMTFPTLQSVIGPGAFGIFACITMALFFFVRKYLPETRGRDPSDIAVLCKHGLRSRPLDSASSSNTEEVTDMKSVN